MTGKKKDLEEIVEENTTNKKKGRNKNERRKDNKGRVLYENEAQDSQGRYIYTYYDKYNRRKMVRSWKLQPSDKLPAGKQDCKSLRELEEDIEKDLHDNIDVFVGKKATVNDRFQLYIDSKVGELKPSTRSNYLYMHKKFIKDEIGQMYISDVNYSEVKKFYNELIAKKHLKPNTVDNVHTLLNPVFDRAVEDEIIRKNPCTKAMKEIRNIKGFKKRHTKENINPDDILSKALSSNQQKALLDFIGNDKKYERWMLVVKVLVGSGLRIGECIALTWRDVCFEEEIIHVRQNLIYKQWEDGKCYYRVSDLKTESGRRDIPMFAEVKDILFKEYQRQSKEGFCNTVIDGYTNWVFSNRFGNVLSATSVNDALERICRDYNDEEMYQAQTENRPARLMPHITNHTLRHTFCTRLAEINFPLKVAQNIMGHADVETTLNIYTAVEKRYKKNTVKDFDGKIYLGSTNKD